MFITENADQLIYNNELFDIEILGGVRLEGLDRMRVTLKVSLAGSAVPPLRHNLDLYNDTQVEKMTRKIAERLEIGTIPTSGTLADLTQQLENYRLEKIKEQSNPLQPQSKPLTAENSSSSGITKPAAIRTYNCTATKHRHTRRIC